LPGQVRKPRESKPAAEPAGWQQPPCVELDELWLLLCSE
jgi:hypothetical protein